MRSIHRIILTVLTAASAVSATAAVASAAPRNDSKAALIARADAAMGHSHRSTAGAGELAAKKAGVHATITDGVGTITSAGGESVQLSTNDPANSVVRSVDGGLQALTVLRKGSTATYRLGLPHGLVLNADGSGGFLITDTTHTVIYGSIDAPWALDANGVRLPTTYAVHGNTITQHVTTTGAVYPIVADPTYHWWGYSYALSHYWTDRIVRAVGLGAGAAYLAAELQAAGIITIGTAAATAIVGALLAFGAVALNACDWNGRGVNINTANLGGMPLMWCWAR